jgi:O-antigen/teichoic acid export membrane protein
VSSTKSNYLFNLLLTVVSLIFPILSFPYAARILGPVGIGKVQFIISFSQYFALISALGIPIYGIREIAKVKNDKSKLDKTFSELMIMYVITSVILSILYIITVSVISFVGKEVKLYYSATGIILLGFCSIDWFYAGMEQFKTIAIRSVAIKAISLILLYVFVKTSNDVFTYLLITIFSLLGNNIINIFLVWNRVSIVSTKLNFKRHLKPLFYIFSTSIASSMYTLLDVIILGFLADTKAVGYYSAGVKLAKFSIPFVTSLGAVIIPQISANLEEKNLDKFYDLLNKSFEFVVFISVPISLGLFLFSREALLVFSGPKFLAGQAVMQILAFLPFIIGLGYFFGIQILVASGKDKQLFISVTVGMVVSIVLNFLLIPYFKETGAAYANLVSEIFVTGTYIYFVKTLFEFKINYKSLIQTVISSLVFIPITMILKHIIGNLIFEVLVSIATCSAIYILIQTFLFKNSTALSICNILSKGLKKVVYGSGRSHSL